MKIVSAQRRNQLALAMKRIFDTGVDDPDDHLDSGNELAGRFTSRGLSSPR